MPPPTLGLRPIQPCVVYNLQTQVLGSFVQHVLYYCTEDMTMHKLWC